MNKNNPGARSRTSIAVSGLDTSTPDMQVGDGAMKILHNLRYSGKGWRNMRPFALRHALHGDDDIFRNLNILYHHPAAGIDAYIVSSPREDGRIALAIADRQANGTLKLRSADADLGLNPMYVSAFHAPVIESGQIVGFNNTIILHAILPTTSSVTVTITTRDGDSSSEHPMTLSVGQTSTVYSFFSTTVIQISVGKPEPSTDGTQSYKVYPNKAAAEQAVSPYFATEYPADIQIGHFGNILILTDTHSHRIDYFYLIDGHYRRFEAPAPPIIRQSPLLTTNVVTDTGFATQIKFFDDTALYNKATGSFQRATIDGDFFWGEICYLAAFELFDGRTIAPSALNIASSEPYYCDLLARQYTENNETKTMMPGRLELHKNESGEDTIYADGTFQFMICPFIEISIPIGIDTHLIKNVNIYSTRINPIWDAEKFKHFKEKTVEGTAPIAAPQNYYADNKLPSQPFYFVKSIPIDQFTDRGKYTLKLSGALLNNLEQVASTYEPSDAHTLYFGLHTTYNERLHAAGDLRSSLFDGFGNAFYPEEGEAMTRRLFTRLTIDNQTYFAAADTTRGSLNDVPVYNRIISYPDYRASQLFDASSDGQASHSLELRSALANNYSYAVCPFDFRGAMVDILAGSYVKYSARFSQCVTASDERLSVRNLLTQPNKMRVSALNNPFSFPLANTYAIGTDDNRISAVNSAAIEMSDAKFGEYPLYIFTEEGIFTLQSGSGEVLYSAVVPLNYDRIVNPETLAVNYNVLYITSRGLHAMFSNQASLISEPINDPTNRPLDAFLSTARLCYQHKFGEIILYNTAVDAAGARIYPSAYVFSLASKTWSTRDFLGHKLNTDEIVHRTGDTSICILDLNDEADGAISVRLESRPIKLGSMEFKRLETLIARLWATAPLAVDILAEGSVDLRQWLPLRQISTTADRDITLRRTPRSFRYLRITLTATALHDFELAEFDLETYLRFQHRLR